MGELGLSPASLFQDVSTFTRSVTSGYCMVCSLGFVFGFSFQKETRISTWADTKDELLLILGWGLKHNALFSFPTLGNILPMLAWEGGK